MSWLMKLYKKAVLIFIWFIFKLKKAIIVKKLQMPLVLL